MTVIIIKEEFDTIKTPTRPVFFMLRRKLVFTRILYSHSNKLEIKDPIFTALKEDFGLWMISVFI